MGIAVKKYVVKLSAEERDRLEAMVRAGKNSAQIVTRARILLKADVSDAGEGRSGGGETDHSGLLAGPGGVRPLEPASARRKSRRIEHRRQGQRQYDRTDSKKNALKPHRNRQWVIPPDANAGFVAAMEDVLETYQRPRDPDRPLVCVDETSKQLIAETRAPIPAKPG